MNSVSQMLASSPLFSDPIGGGRGAAVQQALTAREPVSSRPDPSAAELTLSVAARAALGEPTPADDEASADAPATQDSPELRQAFTDFVGRTFYGQMLQSLRKMTDKPAYFHGGRAEEIFRGQLDQTVAEKMTDVTRDTFAGPMYDSFIARQQ